MIIQPHLKSQGLYTNIIDSHIDDLINYELGIGSKEISKNYNILGFTEESEPLVFERDDSKIVNTLVYGYYKRKDSTITKIMYEWDMSNKPEYYNSNRKAPDSVKYFLNSLFDKIEGEMEELHGTPTTNEDSIVENEDYRSSILTWKKNDNNIIELYINISDNFHEKDGIKTTATYRIRLTLYQPVGSRYELNSSILQERMELLDKFFKCIARSNIECARELMEVSTRSYFTESEISSLSFLLDFNEYDLIEASVKEYNDGSYYEILSFKVKSIIPNLLVNLGCNKSGEIITMEVVSESLN